MAGYVDVRSIDLRCVIIRNKIPSIFVNIGFVVMDISSGEGYNYATCRESVLFMRYVRLFSVLSPMNIELTYWFGHPIIIIIIIIWS